MENKDCMSGEQPPAYDSKTEAFAQPNMQPQPQPYMQPQPPPYGYPAQPPMTSHSTVTVVAPQPQTMVASEPVQDNMVISIISIFFCCILGIIATIKASDSKEALKRGDIALAERQSVTAKKLAIAAIVIGCVCGAISILGSILSTSVSSSYGS